jgi:prepilin-type processing-associated H-X9-DG protein
LPYLDLANLYNALNVKLWWQAAENTTVGFIQPSVFLCPSDFTPPTGDYGYTNYAACNGSGVWPGGFDAICTGEAYSDGLFPSSEVLVGPQDVTDGLSQTAAFSERVHGGALAGTSYRSLPIPSPGVIYQFNPAPPTQSQLISDCNNLGSVAIDAGDGAGTPWHSVGFGNLAYTHLLPPGSPSCWGFSSAFSAISADSRHSGGVNLLLADGHVRFVSNGIDAGLWRALGSRNRAERIDKQF